MHTVAFFFSRFPALQYEKGRNKWVLGNRKKARSRKCGLEGGEKAISMQGRREGWQGI